MYTSILLENALPAGMENIITGLIGEGISATYNTDLGGWIGSLTHFEGGKGYWITVSEPIVFSFQIESR